MSGVKLKTENEKEKQDNLNVICFACFKDRCSSISATKLSFNSVRNTFYSHSDIDHALMDIDKGLLSFLHYGSHDVLRC